MTESMQPMHLTFRVMKRSCAVCGGKLVINVSGNRKYTGGHYFGKLSVGDKGKFEYWECDNCYANAKELDL